MLSNAQAALLARLGLEAAQEATAASSSGNGASPEQRLLPGPLSIRAALPWLTASAALAAALVCGVRSRGSAGWLPGQQQPVAAATAEAAADIGLPPQALRPHYSAEQQPPQQQQQAWLRWRLPAAAGQQQEQQQQRGDGEEQEVQVAAVSKQQGTRLVEQWLVSGSDAAVAKQCCLPWPY